MSTAPRFLIKFISTSYMPLDRDIVREMWVYGDLKDRLGIKHRKDRKRGDPEVAPMFHQPHARSQSEVSVVYESGRASTTQLYLDNPPSQPDYVGDTQDPRPMQPVHNYQNADSRALRQRHPSDGTSPTTTVEHATTAAYTQARSISPRQDVPASSYEMQIRHQQDLTGASYRTADEEWDEEPRSRSRTPDNRPGQAL